MSDVIEFEWFKETIVSKLPALPVRVQLSTAYQRAIGVVGWEEGQPVFDRAASSAAEAELVLAAYVGLVLPRATWPSWAESRRSVLVYGEGVLDELMRRHGIAAALEELGKVGNQVAAKYRADTSAFFAEVAAERGK